MYDWWHLDIYITVQRVWMGARNYIRRESPLHSELEALRWAMESILQYSTCQSFGTDYKDLIAMIKEPRAWPCFATKLERIETLQICFPDFKITHIPREKNRTSDFFARMAISFHRELHFVGFLFWFGYQDHLKFE